MVHLDVHVRTPELTDGVARSVYFPDSHQLGDDVRRAVFDSYPDATDYSFKEVAPREVSRRHREQTMNILVQKVMAYASLQSQVDKRKEF